MRLSITSLGSIALAAFALAAGAVGAGAVTVERAVGRDCEAALARDGDPGVAVREWTAPAAGLLTARLEGGLARDWDLAIFEPPDRRAAIASTSFTSDELARAVVSAGDRLSVQACRRQGRAASVPLALEFDPVTQQLAERTSLESVTISGQPELARLERLGIDVTHDVTAAAATVVLHSDAERERLAAAGFAARTLVADLAAANAADRRAEHRAAQRGARSALPSGRDTYRHYSGYTSRLKALADQNPSLVRSIALGQTVDGRPIEGVEIASGVNRTTDGRPVFLDMGLHHAREWPSGELPMEFAIDLVDGFNTGDPRITALLAKLRVVIVPVVNADGFVVSRETTAGEFRRKNCRPTLNDAGVPCEARSVSSGVDLNRNYGAYWAGAGASPSPSSELYRGPAPYSEPESQAVHAFSSAIHPTVLITNHTFTSQGLWLRQPGFTGEGTVTPDEPAMRALGDAMAAATGWDSELAWTFGEITGATEDWNYFAQGTYGYTPEIRGSDFHASFADMVAEEYLGDAGHAGLGVREAYLIAAERAANPADHGIVAGSAPAGATLRLRKAFETPTSQPGLVVDDVLDTRLTVPATGRYRWHVNPSSRPLVTGEKWTMICRTAGGARGSTRVAVARGQKVAVDWSAACGAL